MRAANRLLATLIALVLLGGGLLVAIEIAFARAGAQPVLVPHHRWYRALRDAEWSDPSTRAVLGLMVAVGLALLVLEALKRRPTTLSTQPGESAHYEVDRRSLEASLRRTAESLDGVDRAHARARVGSLDVIARSSRSLAPQAEPRLDDLVSARVDELELNPVPTVRVQIRSDFES